MRPVTIMSAIGLALAPASAAHCAEISTHVLDLARGVGGSDIPVILLRKTGEGSWEQVGQARTAANGRVASFGETSLFPAGTYKLHFDMTAYPASGSTPFFPEIDVVFSVREDTGHFHVPVVVSPFGYSTYRGN